MEGGKEMKLVEKDLTLKQRESLSLFFWFWILACFGLTVAAFYVFKPTIILILFILYLLFKLEMKNNRLMGPFVIKERHEKEYKGKNH